MNNRNGHNWLIWNLANIVSIARGVLTPIVLFVIPWDALFGDFWVIKIKVTLFVLLILTDKLDGYLAKRIGNTKGIGKVIDPLVDKMMHVYGLTFLWLDRLMEAWLIVAITGGEIIVMGIIARGIILVEREERKKYEIGFFSALTNKELWINIYRRVKEKLISDLNVEDLGRIKMWFYFMGYTLTAIRVFLGPFYLLNLFYMVAFIVGILISYYADVKYYEKFEKWKRENFPNN